VLRIISVIFVLNAITVADTLLLIFAERVQHNFLASCQSQRIIVRAK